MMVPCVRAICYLLLLPALVRAQEPAQPIARVHPVRERVCDILHYRLNLTIDEKTKTCSGIADITMFPLRPMIQQIELDAAPPMTIADILLNGRPAEFSHVGDSLRIALDRAYALDETLAVSINYSVKAPPRGMYFIPPDEEYPHKLAQVWTQGEPEDNRYWFPCYDYPNEKASSEMIVTVNDPLVAVSNGVLLSVDKNALEKKTTYHWREEKPHVSYCVSLAVGDYVEVKDEWNDIPIHHYVYRGQESQAEVTFRDTPKMMEYFTTLTGVPYPWEKYGHVIIQDFMFSGQENVSVSTLTDQTMHDSRADLDKTSDDLIAHELVHQWYGDLISFRDWSNAWLSEGFATYFEFLYLGHDQGKDEFERQVFAAQTAVAATDFTEERRITAPRKFIKPSQLFDNRIYHKGACILHMLRFTVGEELFWKALQQYTESFAFKNVETNDLKTTFESVTGYDLSQFFNQWVFQAGHPEFTIKLRWEQPTREVVMTVEQTQQQDSLTGIFVTPVDIEVWVNNAPETYRVTIDEVKEEFRFPAYQQPQMVLFDKGSWLLKKTVEDKSVEEWMFQLQHADHGVDRLRAVEELRWIADSGRVRDALSEALLNDRFWAVRREAAWALMDAREDISERLLQAYGDRDARVRATVVDGLGQSTAAEPVLPTLLHAFHRDSSYAVAAAALRSLATLDSTKAREYCDEALKRSSHKEVLRTTALSILAAKYSGSKETKKLVQSYAAPGNTRVIRIHALALLGKHWKDQESTVDFLLSLLGDKSFHVRRSVINLLGEMAKPVAYKPLKERLDREPESRLHQTIRDAMAKIQQAYPQHGQSSSPN